MTDVHAEQLDLLRTRTSEKWRSYPEDILPLFVAEMDYPLAEPIVDTIIEQVRRSDIGYVGSPGPLSAAFAGFAERSWGWLVDQNAIRTTTDVSMGIVEILRQVLAPSDTVVLTPPVYPPFFDLVPEAGGKVVEVPLIDDGDSWHLDLDGLDRAFAAGARAFILCNPHNPVGLVHSADALIRLAELAAHYGVIVVSDEIHAPLVHSEASFTPFLSVSDAAREYGVCVTSASKGWNLAGAKCALMIAASAPTMKLLDSMSYEVGCRTSLLGLHASIAAFTHGGEWLEGVLRSIRANRELLGSLLAEHLPGIVYRQPQATYLAWLDFRALGWGDDPSIRALERGRVALNPGPSFGVQGRGFARLNFACSPEVLAEAVSRLANLGTLSSKS